MAVKKDSYTELDSSKAMVNIREKCVLATEKNVNTLF